tara:strand:+ start:424 stop:624 length:201 start_codon:yes stop_codon:yes gene_type:complete
MKKQINQQDSKLYVKIQIVKQIVIITIVQKNILCADNVVKDGLKIMKNQNVQTVIQNGQMNFYQKL